MSKVTIRKSTSLVPNSQVDYIFLDGSGSMNDKWWDTLDAIQAYVDTTKSLGVSSRVIVQTCDDTERDLVQRDVMISEWTDMRTDPLGAHFGYSPIYDGIILMGARLRDINPPRASIVVVTDGEANFNDFADLTQAKAVLDWCRAKGWQVTFIGAEFNNDAQARGLGANRNNAIGVQKLHLVDAAKELARKRARYAASGAPMHWSEEERQQFGGYLAAPDKDK